MHTTQAHNILFDGQSKKIKQTIALRMLALNGSSMDRRRMMASSRIKVAASNNTSDADA
jgi:hypothetical protein